MKYNLDLQKALFTYFIMAINGKSVKDVLDNLSRIYTIIYNHNLNKNDVVRMIELKESE